MSFLRAHWRFLAITVVSVTFVFYAKGQVAPVAAKAKSDLNSARSTLDSYINDVLDDVETYGAPANVAILKLRARRSALQELIEAQSGKLSFQIASDYNIDSVGATADDDARYEFYLNRLTELTGRLRFTRFWKPVVVGTESQPSSVGFDFSLSGNRSSTTLKQKLLRLDILRRISNAASDQKVTEISECFFMADGSLAELARRIPSTQRAASHSGSNVGNQPLRTIGVSISGHGSQQSLVRFLADLQQSEVQGASGRGLAIENFKLWKEDWRAPESAEISFEATIVAYSVIPEAELPEASLKIAMARYREATGEEGPGTDTPEDPFGTGTGTNERPPKRRR